MSILNTAECTCEWTTVYLSILSLTDAMVASPLFAYCEQFLREHECTYIYLSLCFHFFEDLPRSRIARTYGNSTFNFFLRNDYNVPPFSIPPHRFPISSHPLNTLAGGRASQPEPLSGGTPGRGGEVEDTGENRTEGLL